MELTDIDGKLKNYFFYPNLKNSSDYNFHLDRCEKYFISLKLVKNGVTTSKISKYIKIPKSTVSHWVKGHFVPDLLGIAFSIPIENPKDEYKCLPLRMASRSKPMNFIEVPLKIRNYDDILHVLNQLQNEKKERKCNSFEFFSGEDAFGYLLGLIVSDADKSSTSKFSRVCRLRLSKKYNWSLELGNAFCQSIKRISFDVWKEKDTKPFKNHPHGCYNWTSEASPFFEWIMKVCLGLKTGQLTTYDRVKIDWIFNTPRYFRKAFLNGLFDGDGCVSINGWYIANSCSPNQIFVKKLLETLGIRSAIQRDNVVITELKSLVKAIKLPIFRFAKGRLKKSYKLLNILKNRRSLRELNNISLLERIKELHNNQLSSGTISEMVFDEFGIGINPTYILRFRKKLM
jgi:hypothetical protein